MKIVDWELLETCIKNDKEVNLKDKIEKLMEESGELAQAHLACNKSVNKSASVENPEMEYMQECCDVLNVALDIAYAYNISREILQEVTEDSKNYSTINGEHAVLAVGLATGRVIEAFLTTGGEGTYNVFLISLIETTMNALAESPFTTEQIRAMFTHKLTKWRNKQIKIQELNEKELLRHIIENEKDFGETK